mmetsp:Transcript_81225/g.122066  ORF Transcript_81225/g.122066 Transcript_81225/m.122066 type:complete len:101 (-) Transcript_81225:84-386(-)
MRTATSSQDSSLPLGSVLSVPPNHHTFNEVDDLGNSRICVAVVGNPTWWELTDVEGRVGRNACDESVQSKKQKRADPMALLDLVLVRLSEFSIVFKFYDW